jgi:uncharacterized protein
VVVGRDGLVLRAGRRSGLLLPQVPVEWGWDRDEYLRRLREKAGIPAGTPGEELHAFTAEHFEG